MAYVINDDCISCGVCAGNCPVSAISEGDGKYVIDADTCIDCGGSGSGLILATEGCIRQAPDTSFFIRSENERKHIRPD